MPEPICNIVVVREWTILASLQQLSKMVIK